MSENKNLHINGLLITGILAIFSTAIGGFIGGRMDADLAKQKFESDLIIKALESTNRKERKRSLSFLAEVGLISNEELNENIVDFVAKKSPNEIPNFSASNALQEHEKIFYSDKKIMGFTQSKADNFCREKFQEFKKQGNLTIDPKDVINVWGHIDSGFCVVSL